MHSNILIINKFLLSFYISQYFIILNYLLSENQNLKSKIIF